MTNENHKGIEIPERELITHQVLKKKRQLWVSVRSMAVFVLEGVDNVTERRKEFVNILSLFHSQPFRRATFDNTLTPSQVHLFEFTWNGEKFNTKRKVRKDKFQLLYGY